MSTPPLPDPGLLTRRRLLGTAGAAGLLPLTAACGGSPLDVAEDRAAGPQQPDPDEDILRTAVRLEEEVLADLRALLPRSARRVRPTLAVHQAHLTLLRGAEGEGEDGQDAGGPDEDGPDEGRDAGTAPAGGRLTLRQVSAAEARLARRHAEAAVRASSGHFARVLAGMAAAAAQQADVWRGGAG